MGCDVECYKRFDLPFLTTNWFLDEMSLSDKSIMLEREIVEMQ